jgi:hypothetical protein
MKVRTEQILEYVNPEKKAVQKLWTPLFCCGMKANGPKSGSLYITLLGNLRHLFQPSNKMVTSGLSDKTYFKIKCPILEMVHGNTFWE